MAGLLDFLDPGSVPMTPQQMGLLGAAAAVGQAYAPQPASRLPLAQPSIAYLLSQAAGGYGHGYGAGLQQQEVQTKTAGQQIQNANAALNYNLWAPYLGAQPIGTPTVGGMPRQVLPAAPAAATPTPAPAAAEPQRFVTVNPGAPPGAPDSTISDMPGDGLKPVTLSPSGDPIVPAPVGAPAPAPAAAPALAAAAGTVTPAGARDMRTMMTTLPPPVLQRMGITVPPELNALYLAGIGPGDPRYQAAVNTMAIKGMGINPVIGGDRPGVVPQNFDLATMTYKPQEGAFDTMQRAAYTEAFGKSQGGLPADLTKLGVELANKQKFASYERGLNLATTVSPVQLPNGQTRLMTGADQLRLAQGQPMTAPPEPMAIKGDDVVTPSGSVIPSPPPAEGSGMPGFTAGVPENRAKITEGWTNSIAPSIHAESQLMQIADALKATQSGGLNEQKAKLANALGGMGPAGKAIAEKVMSAKSVADVQTVMHANVMATLDSLKSIVSGTGSRMLKTEFDKVSGEALAHPDISPEANYRIITQMTGILRHGRTLATDWSQASSGPAGSGRQWTDPQKFQSAWEQRNPLQPFIDQVGTEIGPLKGMPGNPANAPTATVGGRPYRWVP